MINNRGACFAGKEKQRLWGPDWPKGVVKNLGTWLDSTLSMNSHVNNTCSNAFLLPV